MHDRAISNTITATSATTTTPPHRHDRHQQHATSPTTTSIDMPPPARSTANSNLAPPLASLGSYTAHPHPAYNLNHSRRLPYDALTMLFDSNNNNDDNQHPRAPRNPVSVPGPQPCISARCTARSSGGEERPARNPGARESAIACTAQQPCAANHDVYANIV